MSVLWQKMSVEEFASFQRRLGRTVIGVNGIYWRQARPFFFRPLLPFREYGPQSVSAPRVAVFGGFQHAVPPQETSNSLLNLLAFDNPEAYSLGSLDYNRKRQVKLAAKQFVIRPITDVEEFKQNAYSVYLTFYERTQYNYKSERRYKEEFSRWSEILFRVPKNVVLGGYRNGKLGAVSVSHLVEDSLFYSTFFCDNDSLRLSVSDLMLHSVREAAVENQDVKRIFVGMYTGEKGVNDFYLLRGCQIVKKPAALHINPLAMVALRCCIPKQYARLCGRFDTVRGS